MLGVFDIAKFARLDELVMHSSVKEEQERLLLALQLELFALSCLLYTSPSPRDGLLSRMPSSA